MMIFLKLLLSSGLMLIAETAFILNESSLCYQPSKYIKPNHYDIKFISLIDKNIFHGEYNISISILNKTQNILINNIYSQKIYFYNIVLIRNSEKYHENANYTVYKSTFNIEEDIIDISFENELLLGNYILYIKYAGLTDKIFRSFDVKEKLALVAITHFHIIDNQQIMSSCWDQQYLFLEATFNISIGCYQCTVLSNMPLRNTEIYKDNMLLTHFDTTLAMSPYLVTIFVSNYLLRVDNNTQNIQMWCRNESVFYMEFAKNVAENITLFFKNKWNQRSNSILNVTHVVIPNFSDNGIIVFGLVFYKETDIIYDQNLYPVAHKIKVAQLVGHKVTQQWFYNLNNPFQLASWLNKALITLLATYAVNEIYPDNRTINLFVVQNQHTSFHLDDDYCMRNSTSQDYSLLKIRQSIRAPFILRMMQHAFTDEIFWKGVRSYTNSTQFHRQSFMTFLEEVVADAKKLGIDISLQTIEYWTLEKHCPVIKVIRNYNNFWRDIHVSVQNYDTLEIDCFHVTFTTQTNPNFNNFTHYSLCKSSGLAILSSFEEDGWIIFNIQQIGYYRVNYDDENWRRISNYLNSADFKTIHVLNRAQIIDDAYHLMITGQLEACIFWNIISYLSQEEDYVAWYPMFKALEHMFNNIPVALLEMKNWSFKERIRAILNKVLTRVKYEEIDDIDELRICLRQEAARWACVLGDMTCKKEANNKLKQHLNDPMTHRLLPWWKEWTYCNGLMLTKEATETWQLIYTKGLDTSDTKFFKYLACTKDIDIIIKLLELIPITQNKNQKFLNSFLHVITKHAQNEEILTYILDHFHKIKPKNVNIIAALIIIINNVYSIYLIEEILDLILKNHDSIIETNIMLVEVNNTKEVFGRHQIKEMTDTLIDKNSLYYQIRNKVIIRKKQIERQRQYFENYFF